MLPRPYKVLIGFSLEDSALSSFFSRVCREFSAQGHGARALVWPALAPGSPGAAGIDWAAWPSPRPTHAADLRFLGEQIRTYRPEALIANFASVNLMTFGGWRWRVPMRGVHYHTLRAQLTLDSPRPGLRFAWQQVLKNLVYRLSTHILANSAASAQDAAAGYRGARGKCTVLHFGLPDPGLAREASARLPHRVICPGRLHYSKGQDVLVRAVAALAPRFPELEVRFVGNGPQAGPLQALAASLGVARHCRFLGAKSHEEVVEDLGGAAVAVVPSRAEGFGLVNLEALACGTPVVGSAVGGIPEIVREGEEGFLVPAEDPSALADRLQRLLSDPVLRARMSHAARERFLSTFELGVRASAYVKWVVAELDRMRTGA